MLLGQLHSCLYDTIPGIALGEEEELQLRPSAEQDIRLCFNCGSLYHAVASCPEPINRQVVSLSRQLFKFLHPDLPGQETPRFYVAEGWKQQRLEWLGSFEPGMICGPLLRDALGLQEGDPGNAVEWLRNMAYWGYPPGWVGCRDPRQLVYSRILEDEADESVAAAEWESFTIFEGADSNEEINLRSPGLQSSSSHISLSTSVDAGLTRWATYPNTYFSSTALSICNGTPLDVDPCVSATFTPERRTLWEHILSRGLDPNNALSVPPWRMANTFGASSCSAVNGSVEDFTPPPPPTAPPPLPPTPNPPLHTFTSSKRPLPGAEPAPLSKFEGIIHVTEDTTVIDMDISDDSE